MRNDKPVDSEPSSADADGVQPEQLAGYQVAAVPKSSFAWAQSVGCQREHNEDSLFVLSSTLSSEDGLLPFGLYVIADGMGGHLHGEKASNIAVRAFSSYLVSALLSKLLSPEEKAPEPIQELANAAIQQAQQQVSRQIPGGGTTLTSLLILGEQMTISHVGDSRAYFFPTDGTAKVLTQDHSLVNKLIELGHLDLEQAAMHPQRNVLYRAIGQPEPLSADIFTLPLPARGALLLCSDGLWGSVSDGAMANIIFSASDPQNACQELIDAANQAGGPDNISAILIRLHPTT